MNRFVKITSSQMGSDRNSLKLSPFLSLHFSAGRRPHEPVI